MHLTTTEIALIGAGASLAVALGTLVLGWQTRSLAKKTGDMAEQTTRAAVAAELEAEAVKVQSELSRKALQAAVQPWLTRLAPETTSEEVVSYGDRPMYRRKPFLVYVKDEDDGSYRVSLHLQNIGPGIALIGSGDHCVVEGGNLHGKTETRYGFPTASALASGEITWIGFKVEHVDPDSFFDRKNTMGQFWVNIRYTDANTEQPVWARIHLTAKDEGKTGLVFGNEWFFYQIHYTREGEEKPFAVIQFDAALQPHTDGA